MPLPSLRPPSQTADDVRAGMTVLRVRCKGEFRGNSLRCRGVVRQVWSIGDTILNLWLIRYGVTGIIGRCLVNEGSGYEGLMQFIRCDLV